jgi:hypothetical protein
MATYYAHPTGSDAAAGTYLDPWWSINKFVSVAAPGDGLYMRDGLYEYTEVQLVNTAHGTGGSHITVSAYPNEVPVLDFTLSPDHQGLRPSGVDYWDFIGLEIQNVPEHGGAVGAYGIFCYNCNNCTFTRMNCHNIGGWGIALQDTGTCTNLLFDRCDCHHNYTPADNYGGGDGFQSGGSPTTTGITLRDCRFWYNCDDGVDLRVCDGLYTIENCWTFWNGYREDHVTTGGNGEGLKLAGTDQADTANIRRVVKNCLVFENRWTGMANSPDTGYVGMEIYNTVVYGNGEGACFNFTGAATLQNCVSYANIGDDWRDGGTHDHNNWDIPLTIVDGDFLSVDSTGVDGARGPNGELPVLDFLKPSLTSQLIAAGTAVASNLTDGEGNTYLTPRSIGAYETVAAVIPVTAVTVTGTGGATTISVDNGTLQMLKHIDPHNATDQTVTWSVVNGTGSATISATGLLTAVSDGKVTVVATANG